MQIEQKTEPKDGFDPPPPKMTVSLSLSLALFLSPSSSLFFFFCVTDQFVMVEPLLIPGPVLPSFPSPSFRHCSELELSGLAPRWRLLFSSDLAIISATGDVFVVFAVSLLWRK